MHPRAAPQDQLGGLGAAADQVLAVVQHDQDVLRGQRIEQGLGDGHGPAARRSPAPEAMAGATASWSATAASSTSHTPSPDPSSSSAATCRPSLVLPHPPAPVSVTRREDSTRARTSASSRPRPMNVASWAGRLFGSAALPSERSGGNSACRPAACSWKICSGRSQVLQPVHTKIPQRRARRKRSRAPARPPSPTPAPAPHARPPPPARRDAHPGPPGRRPYCDASPVCIPIRTRTRSPAGQACAWIACCISSTAAAHARGEENTAKNASPWVSSSLPPCAARADRTRAR